MFGKCASLKYCITYASSYQTGAIRHFSSTRVANSTQLSSLFSSTMNRLKTLIGPSNSRYVDSMSFLKKSIRFRRPEGAINLKAATISQIFKAFMPNSMYQYRADFWKAIRSSASMHLYRSAFYLQSLLGNIRARLRQSLLNFNGLDKVKRTALLSSIGIFKWEDWSIENEDIQSEIDDMLKTFKKNTHVKDQKDQAIKINFEFSRTIEVDHDWHKVYDKKDLIIWRRKLSFGPNGEILNDHPVHQHPSPPDVNKDKTARSEDSHEIFEYKVLGRLNDVTPLEFFHTQIDLDYRKEWDYLVISIDLVDRDKSTNTELIRWMMKFPYPLYPREYVFVRRACVEKNQKILVVVSQGLPECELPIPGSIQGPTQPVDNQTTNEGQNGASQQSDSTVNQVQVPPKTPAQQQAPLSQNVRVTRYKSNMIIIPHEGFDDKGLDYVIQYYDDSKARIPKLAYQWVTASGLPDYTEKLHRATIKAKSKKTDLGQIFSCCESSEQRPEKKI